MARHGQLRTICCQLCWWPAPPPTDLRADNTAPTPPPRPPTCIRECLALALIYAHKQGCQLVAVLLLNAGPGISNSLGVNTNLTARKGGAGAAAGAAAGAVQGSAAR